MLVGIISDTHGLVRPEAVKALAGVSLIIHAGDVGGKHVLEALGAVAPVTAVRGNTDREHWAWTLNETEVVEAGNVSMYVLHDLHKLDLDPSASSLSAVISGHSHKPLVQERNGVLYLNPGSAGPRRYKLPVSLALLRIQEKSLSAEIVQLLV